MIQRRSLVTRGIGEKLRIVARAAERGDVLAVLVEVGVGSTLVDRGHGNGFSCFFALKLAEFRKNIVPLPTETKVLTFKSTLLWTNYRPLFQMKAAI